MAEEIKTPMSDFDEVSVVKDTAKFILLQDGVNARVDAPVFEQKLLDKTNGRYLGKTETAESAKGNGEIVDSNNLAISGSKVFNKLKSYTTSVEQKKIDDLQNVEINKKANKTDVDSENKTQNSRIKSLEDADFVKKADVKNSLTSANPLPINAKAVLDKDYVQQQNVLSNLDIASKFPVDSKAVDTTINILKDTMKGYISEQEFNANFAYGVEWDATVADPKLTRIGNEISHKTLPVHNLLKGCILKSNGEVNYYLDATDWTKKENGQSSKLDGTDGDVMVEIPEIYFLAEKEGNKRRLMVLDRPFTGAKRFKKRYVSAYEATLERNTSTMRSVMNASDNYKGHTGEKGNLAPLSAVSRATARSYARKRKGFEVMDITTYNILVWLYFIEFANRNSQLPVASKVGGLTTGGLGDGITTLSDEEWNTYNERYGLPVIGKSNSLGNGSGEVNVGLTEFKDAMMCRYRGVENFFGNIVKLLDGIQLYRDVEGGIFSVFVTENTELFNDANHNGFGYIGEFPITGGYVKDINFPFNVPATRGGGSSTTYYCDNCYAPSDYTGYTWYVVGGYCHSGALAGVGYSSTAYRVSTSYSNCGFRLCFIAE